MQSPGRRPRLWFVAPDGSPHRDARGSRSSTARQCAMVGGFAPYLIGRWRLWLTVAHRTSRQGLQIPLKSACTIGRGLVGGISDIISMNCVWCQLKTGGGCLYFSSELAASNSRTRVKEGGRPRKERDCRLLSVQCCSSCAQHPSAQQV